VTVACLTILYYSQWLYIPELCTIWFPIGRPDAGLVSAVLQQCQYCHNTCHTAPQIAWQLHCSVTFSGYSLLSWIQVSSHHLQVHHQTTYSRRNPLHCGHLSANMPARPLVVSSTRLVIIPEPWVPLGKFIVLTMCKVPVQCLSHFGHYNRSLLLLLLLILLTQIILLARV